jgi:hypothetical protein
MSITFGVYKPNCVSGYRFKHTPISFLHSKAGFATFSVEKTQYGVIPTEQSERRDNNDLKHQHPFVPTQERGDEEPHHPLSLNPNMENGTCTLFLGILSLNS